MNRPRFSRRAELDLIDGLMERAEELRAAPEMGPLYPMYGEGIRGLSFRPYVILHRTSDEDVFIERVIHGARLPKNIK